MKWAVLAAVPLFLCGCESVGQFLNEPAAGPTVQAAPPEPVEVETPDGGTVTYTPAEPSGEPTKGDVIASTIGTAVAALGANPGLGVLASGALSALFKRK